MNKLNGYMINLNILHKLIYKSRRKNILFLKAIFLFSQIVFQQVSVNFLQLFKALILLFLYIILQDKYQWMNNFNFCNNMYYQFWMMPSYIPSRPSYYPTVAFYPQLLRQQESNLIIQTPFSYSNSNLPVQQPRQQPKPQLKQVRQQPPQKSEPQKLTVVPEISLSKQITKITNKSDIKKANRPQTYLTEKAYYMKQKLKGKFINGSRLLRRRLKLKETKTVKVIQPPKSNKKASEITKALVKRLPIIRDSQKQRKILTKIRLKLAKQNHDQFAKIPRLISGVRQLNQFCKLKIENLMQRQMKQD